mgnify:FL=1
MNDPKLRFKYVYAPRFGSHSHVWQCIGGQGAVHLHISGPHHYDNLDHWSAGIEFHSRFPRNGQEHDAPSHDMCEVLKAPCWHDGSSLYASEHYLPIWVASPHGHEALFQNLANEYRKFFMRDKEEGQGTSNEQGD